MLHVCIETMQSHLSAVLGCTLLSLGIDVSIGSAAGYVPTDSTSLLASGSAVKKHNCAIGKGSIASKQYAD